MDKEYQEKLSHLHELIKLSRIDDNVSLIESTFIERVATRLGVPKADLEKVKKNEFKFTPSTYEFERIPQFHRILILMGIDLVITEEEAIFCKQVGIKMGLNPNAILDLLEIVKKKPVGLLKPSEITEIFKRYES
ncbi:MAG: hypothetical protein AAFX87_00430 [Bacteroidota bacterium]